MGTTTRMPASKSPFRYGNPTIDCKGAEVHTLCKQLASVMTVSGFIDQTNVECLSDRARHCVIPEKAFVLDLTGVESFAKAGIALLDAIDDACFAAGVEWSLVAGEALTHILRVHAQDPDLPVAHSVPEALHHFSDVADERRRLLPMLTKSA
ncbi:STAS domain-containing protein [Mycolicibacterium sediminis]|uniref:Anti-sigma factor antagonist n=1 Tax=Mycolicibacterium sediminis TaxID=1286180 RepID=A0A7I7QMX4_9MYCO|nr:STAS domain-containing protein [Mycolicibacterium sediminis]BBY27605.1 anti-sigma factor antagonist [Mycolicibacterium sediminis]